MESPWGSQGDRADRSSLATYAAIAAVVLGLVLRAWQYFANPSISADEAGVARNVLDRNLWTLVAFPLSYGQVSPPGWLALVKAASEVLGPSEKALRLIPFIGGFLTVPVSYLVARRAVGPWGSVVVALLVSLATPLVLFSSNLKPYATDVLIALGVVLLSDGTIRHTALTTRDVVWRSLAGIVALLLSSASVFVIVPGGATILWFALGRSDLWPRATIVGVWAAATAAAVWLGTHSMTATDAAYMHMFWADSFGPASALQIPSWTWERLHLLFGATGGAFHGNMRYVVTTPIVVAVLIGAISLMRTNPRHFGLFAGPSIAVFVAAILRRYPFDGRLVVFLVPLLLVLAVAGAEAVARVVRWRPGVALLPLLLVPTAAHAALANRVPQHVEHLRPVLEYVQAHRQSEDVVWVYYGAGITFRYYQHLIPLTGDVSECDRANPLGQVRQVDHLRGRTRVWIVGTHAGAHGAGNERLPLLAYLDRIGTRRETFPPDFDDLAPAAAAFAVLYDLSDPTRLNALSIESLEPPSIKGHAWSCYGTMTPDEAAWPRAAAAVIEAAH